MKKLFAIITLSLAVALCACDDDNNPSWPVPQPAVQSLFELYPTAYNINWYNSGQFSVARFKTTLNGAAQQRWAWFDNAGTWYMTETGVVLAQMPQPVRNAFLTGAYGTWEFEEGDRIERAAMTDIYVVKAQGSGNHDNTVAALYYTADGSLVKTVFNPSKNYRYEELLPTPLPAAISAFIQSEYPAALLISSDFSNTPAQVEIIDEGVLRTLCFNSGNQWLYTVTEVAAAELPAAVRTALEQSSYAAWTINEVRYYNTPDDDYYRLTLESGSQTTKVDITPEGVLTIVNAGF